jgi:hypothetical protein
MDTASQQCKKCDKVATSQITGDLT